MEQNKMRDFKNWFFFTTRERVEKKNIR